MAAGATYEAIATTTLSSSANDVTFSSIPGTYTDLVVVFTTKTTTNSRAVLVQVNSDTGSNYSITRLGGNGSAASSSRESSQTQWAMMEIAGTSDTEYWQVIGQFMNYSNSTTNKTALFRVAGKGETQANVALWRSTSAITSIKLYMSAPQGWASGNTFTLYGIKSE